MAALAAEVPGRALHDFFRSLLEIRKALRHDEELRRWIHHTTLDCSSPGHTGVSLKLNRSPTRTSLDLDLLPDLARFRSG